jgi:spermidine synthase
LKTAAAMSGEERTTARDGSRRLAVGALMIGSGFAGLGYQIVWTEQARTWLGHEAPAVLAIVAAFFGGLALGGLAFGPRLERSQHPVRWYAGAELVIGGHALLLLAFWSPFGIWMERATGVEPSPLWQWSVTFTGTFVFLLPATAAMGVTLPAMARLARELGRRGQSVASLYASNTFGGVLGVLGVAFALVPELGLFRSTLVCAGLNLCAGVLALGVFPRTAALAAAAPAPSRSRARDTLFFLALTGFLGIGYEVVVVRVLSEVTEDTVYTFALLLAVYLVGTALGAAAFHRLLEPRLPRKAVTGALFSGLAAACLLGTFFLWGAERFRLAVVDVLGPGMTAALAAEGCLALAAFGLPTIAMGATWSHLCERALRNGVSFGHALGVNTLAAAAAPVLFGVCALPALGSKIALVSIVALYLAPALRRRHFRPLSWATAAGAAAVGLFAPPLAFIEVPAGGHIVSHEEGVMSAVSVVEDSSGVRRLRINDREQEGSSASFYVDARQAWLPLLLHHAPRHALFLGLGTGVTASSATLDPALEVDAVELLPEVIRASSAFARAPSEVAAKARLQVLAADARRYVRASERHYDVIVSDNFHPARSGSGALYTVEHFDAVRRRLAESGVFCQWLPLHQLDLQTLGSIVHAFLEVYPRATALIANNSLETPVVGLVGRRDGARFDPTLLALRRANASEHTELGALGLDDEFAVLGSFIGGPRALAHFSEGAAVNTDDRPIVAYRAPRITYAPDSTPRDRLVTLLGELTVEPDELVLPSGDASFEPRLRAYFAARNRFVGAGRDVRPSPNVEDMLAQVQGPLLSILRQSPDFRPAYDPLLSMAEALAHSDVPRARTLLAELARVQPARTEASRLLRLLGDETATTAAVSR